MPTQPLFDAWDCTPPIVPPRSRLYAVQPIGIGTAFVESLSGYLARLADAHAVSVGNLVLRELSTLVAYPLFHSSVPNTFHGRFYAMNGLGDPARKWVEALQAGTMQRDLCFLTLLPFADLLWPLAIFRRRRAWCSECYEYDRANGKPVYERLIWALRVVTICAQHRRALKDICPNCSQKSKPITAFARPGYCSRCQAWLGNDDSIGDGPDPTDVENWSAGEVGALLALAPQLGSTSLRISFTMNFRAFVDHVAQGHKIVFADAAKISAETLRDLLNGSCQPGISTLLRISCHLKVPVVSFLEPDLVRAAAIWQIASVRVLKARLPSTRSRESVKAELERAASEQPPPRLSDVARRLNYIKLDRLYRVDAKLCRRIASNYQKTLRAPGTRATDKRFCSPQQMQRALEESLAQDLPTSPYHVSLELGFVGDAPLRRKFPSLCQAIQEKIDTQKALRIAATGRALKAALAEEPPPSLTEMCRRLGCCRPVVLRRRFSDLCNQLLELRHACRIRAIENLRNQLHGFTLESAAVSLERACKRVEYSRQQLLRLCPNECAAIVAHFERCSRETAQRKIEELYRQTRQIVTRLHTEGQRPSVKRVKALLGKSVSQNWRETTAAIRAAKAELANHVPACARPGPKH
jgi:transcriptional regulator with XRE-family HTH domain